MSVLDELRKKADEKKAAEQQQAITNDLLAQVYQTEILPKIQLIYDSFQEAINYLNFLEEPVRVDHYCARYPQFASLYQTNYRINTDGRIGLADYNRIMQVNVGFFCEGKGDFSYRLESESVIEKEIEFLQARNLLFDWKHIAPVAGVSNAIFTIQRKIPVSFRVEVDYEHSKLKVAIRNHENLMSFRKTFSPEQLNQEFVDSLLRYFLRKDSAFVKVDELPTELKEAIKTAVQTNAANYQKRYEQTFVEEEVDSGKKNPLKSLFSRFKKP